MHVYDRRCWGCKPPGRLALLLGALPTPPSHQKVAASISEMPDRDNDEMRCILEIRVFPSTLSYDEDDIRDIFETNVLSRTYLE